MKLTILQENLQKGLSFVGKNVSAKTQLPILSNILLKTDKGQLMLASTNLETSVSFWSGASIDEKGEITVPARLFTELVSSFPQEKVVIEQKETAIQLVCGKSEARLAGVQTDEFPPLPKPEGAASAQIATQQLAKSLPFVTISASLDESRPILTGVRFVQKEDKLLIVATDGFRLSVKTIPKISGFEEGCVIPARALSEMLRIAQDTKSESIALHFSKEANQVILEQENAQIATRLIEGEYPDFSKIIPASFTTRAVFEKETLLKAVKFASVYAKEAANVIRLEVGPGQTVISANSPQIGDNKTSLSAEVEGEGGVIAFNARFLIDLLQVFPEDRVAFEMSGSLSPGVFKPVEDESFLHIIMPIRLQE